MYPGTMMPNDPNKAKLVTLTRTDFLIQFVWQPPKPEERPKTPEELKTKIAEAYKQLAEAAEKNKADVVVPKDSDLEAASRKVSQEVVNALNKAAAPSAPTPGAPAATPAPAPAAPATPAK
jgi:type IV pilus assembly protein PilM